MAASDSVASGARLLTAAAAAVQDAEVREQIERDVMRTHPDMHFFSGDDPPAMLHRAVSAHLFCLTAAGCQLTVLSAF